MSGVAPIPESVPQLTPHLVVHDAAAAIDFYARALGARELYRSPTADGRIMLAELVVLESRLFIVDEFPEQGFVSPRTLGGTPVALHLYVPDVDAACARAEEAGMTLRMPVADYFWGDRYAQLQDPFGHVWGLASRIADLTPEEIRRRAESFFITHRS